MLGGDGMTDMLSVEGVTKHFPPRRRGEAPIVAVADVSFTVAAGETVGIVGESGSGKTTVARLVLRLLSPTAGVIRLRGADIHSMAPEKVRRDVRPAVRMVFQDPDAALNPACRVSHGLAQAVRLHRPDVQDVRAFLEQRVTALGLAPHLLDKWPDELSGGEKRRLGVCRALLTDPDVLVADEPLSGLDVLLQERVLALIRQQQRARAFGFVLVSHDLDRVHQVCDRVLVMRGGRLLEDVRIVRTNGRASDPYQHPYSRALRRASQWASDGDAHVPDA